MDGSARSRTTPHSCETQAQDSVAVAIQVPCTQGRRPGKRDSKTRECAPDETATKQKCVSRNRGPGKGGMEARKISSGRNFSCFLWPTSPAAFWFLCRRGQRNSPRRAKYPVSRPARRRCSNVRGPYRGGPKGPPYSTLNNRHLNRSLCLTSRSFMLIRLLEARQSPCPTSHGFPFPWSDKLEFTAAPRPLPRRPSHCPRPTGRTGPRRCGPCPGGAWTPGTGRCRRPW